MEPIFEVPENFDVVIYSLEIEEVRPAVLDFLTELYSKNIDPLFSKPFELEERLVSCRILDVLRKLVNSANDF